MLIIWLIVIYRPLGRGGVLLPTFAAVTVQYRHRAAAGDINHLLHPGRPAYEDREHVQCLTCRPVRSR